MNIHFTTKVRYILLLVSLFCAFPLWAEDYTKNGIVYELDDATQTAKVKDTENNSITTAKIEKRVAGYDVTSIGDDAFFDCNALTSINIPSSVTSIGQFAFEDCSALTSINIPNSVTSIGDNAFRGCSALTSFSVDASNPNYSSQGMMLFNKDKTQLVEALGSLSSYDIPNSVTSIGYYAFYGCSALTSINIPNSVTSIGHYAFYNCSALTSINIPNSVTSIGYYAFYNCSALKSVLIHASWNITFGTQVFGDYNNESFYFNGEYCYYPIVIFDNYPTIRFDYSWSSSSFNNDNLGGTLSQFSYKNLDGYIASILTTKEEAKNFINNRKTIYTRLSDDLRVSLDTALVKAEDIDALIQLMSNGNYSELDELNTTLTKSYRNVRNAVYDQIDRNDDLNTLYEDVKSFADENVDDATNYTPLAPYYTTSGSNLLTSADQLSTNKQEESEGALANLVDGDKDTYFHSTWSAQNTDNAYAYLQVDLKGAYQKLLLNYTKRYKFTANKGYPIEMHVYATNTPNDDDSWTDCGKLNMLYDTDELQSGKSFLNLKGEYQYLRLQVEKTGGMQLTNGNLFFALSELGITPVSDYHEAYTANDGLITDASQLSSNAVEPTEGSLAALIDNDLSTYFHSAWSVRNTDEAYHYLQIDLRDAYKQIGLMYSKRTGITVDQGSPITLHIYATNTPNDGTKTCTYDYANATGLLPLELGEGYRYLRLVVEATSANATLYGNLYFYWSELHAYTRASKANAMNESTRTAFANAMKNAKAELNDEWATDETIDALQSAYDKAQEEVANAHVVDFIKSPYLTAYSDKAMHLPTGVKAAVVTTDGNNGIRNDYRYDTATDIPAETGILLKAGRGNSFCLTLGESSDVTPEDNLLHGTLNDEMTNVEGADKYYKLSYDRATGTELGVYWGAENGGAFINKGGKAFLALPATLNAAQLAGFSLFDLDNQGTITGINNAQAPSATATFKAYDLNGRRINAQSANELSKGIYIINGKKTIIK